LGSPLRRLWDFADLEGTRRRFQEELQRQASDEGRAEVLCQLARVAGLDGDLTAAERLLDEAEPLAAGGGQVARAWVLLERGRLRRSGGDPRAALPLFDAAYGLALQARAEALAADAAHMAAFGRALRARERDPARPAEVEVARYAVGRTLRALGRPGEAAALLEQAVAWADAAGQPDGWFHEELAEDYAALGRHADARRQARLALPLLGAADPSFGGDAARVARLAALAGASGQGRPS
jgi:tetratricopeptide (TPR) repeat protein